MTKKGASVRGAFFRRRRHSAGTALEGFAEYYSANPAEKVNRGNGFRGSDMDLASELIEIS